MAILTTTLPAEQTLHVIGKTYAIKTIFAGKILVRNFLDH